MAASFISRLLYALFQFALNVIFILQFAFLFQYCVAGVIADQTMLWGGTTDPCGTATLMSIGKLGVEENKKHAALLYDHIEKNLGIPRTRYV